MKHLINIILCTLAISIDGGTKIPKRNVLPEKKVYNLSPDPVDVVFVCHPKDKRTLDLAIDGIKKNGKNVRRVIVVSSFRLTDNAEWFDEALFPFSKEAVAIEIFRGNKDQALHYLNSPNSRIGWLFAQLLKLHAVMVIPDISPNTLIIDADTVFLNPVEFVDEQGNALYNPGTEYHQVYFEHGAKLIPGFRKIFPGYSGISHHMLFQREIMKDLFEIIEKEHHMEPWRAMCRCIDIKDVPGSAMADYEIYFNFAFAVTDQVRLRNLKWNNIKFNIKDIYRYKKHGYHYVSCHTYIG